MIHSLMKKNQGYIYFTIATVTIITIAFFIVTSGILTPNQRFIGKWKVVSGSSYLVSESSITAMTPETYYTFEPDGGLEVRYESEDYGYTLHGTYDIISSSYIVLTTPGDLATLSYDFSNNNCILTLTLDQEDLVFNKVS